MSTLSKLSIEVNMGRNIRLEMCHGEDFSKIVLVDVTSGQELFSDSGDGDRRTEDDGANLAVGCTWDFRTQYRSGKFRH